MSSRTEILHLINLYGFAIDTGDFDAAAGLFEHGEWEMEGADPFVGKQQCYEAISNVIIYEDGTPRTKHVTSNVDLEIDEEKRLAKSQCYVTVLQQTNTFPLQTIFSGHYFDEFECIEGRWWFKKRKIKHQLVGDLSAHLKAVEKIIPGKESSA